MKEWVLSVYLLFFSLLLSCSKNEITQKGIQVPKPVDKELLGTDTGNPDRGCEETDSCDEQDHTTHALVQYHSYAVKGFPIQGITQDFHESKPILQWTSTSVTQDSLSLT